MVEYRRGVGQLKERIHQLFSEPEKLLIELVGNIPDEGMIS